MRRLSFSTFKIVIYWLQMLFILTSVYLFPAATLAKEKHHIPTVLIVSPKNTAVTENVRDSLESFAKVHLPNHKVIVITGYRVDDDYEVQDIVSDKIREEISEKVSKNNLITHLFLAVHGGYARADDSTYITKISALGRISETSVNEKFDSIFNSIRNQFSPNATIVLNSCNNFCGPESSVIKRATVLAKYFNISEGTVYGATSYDYGGMPSLRHSLRPKLIIASAMGAAVAMILPTVMGNLPTAEYLNLTAMAASVIIPITTAFDYVSNFLVASKNEGRLVTISDGSAVTTEIVKKLESAAEIFGFSKLNKCKAIFSE